MIRSGRTHQASIDLMSFEGGYDRDGFVEQLARLGYEVSLRSPAERRSHGGQASTVLFLTANDPIEDRILCSAETGALDLIVVPLASGCWNCDLLHRCGDVVGWPCDDRELQFRLSRTWETTTPPPPEDPADLAAEFASFNLIGRSTPFLEVLRRIRQIISARDVPVLIEGETGTGKELIARALHYRGHRSGGPFIPVNCGAIPDSLVEGELFGHMRGAFTDAKHTQEGLIEQADTGTLFLDEVEALSPRGQVALLRFLQNQEYRPLGGKRLLRANVRILAATNRSLRSLADQGHFREDLYFRLHVVRLAVPPLRRRREDIPMLAEHFAREFSARYGLAPKALTAATRSRLRAHSWPGNVRELENAVHHLVVMGECSLGAEALASATERPSAGDGELLSFNAAKARAIQEFETEYLHSLLVATKGNVTVAAKRARKERRALGKLIKKHGIHRAHFACAAEGAAQSEAG
jgi:two-component system response regulator AtoC